MSSVTLFPPPAHFTDFLETFINIKMNICHFPEGTFALLHLLNMLKIPTDSSISTDYENHGKEVNFEAKRMKSWRTAAAVLQQRSVLSSADCSCYLKSSCCLLCLYVKRSHHRLRASVGQTGIPNSSTAFLHSYSKFHWRVETTVAAIS